MHSHLCHHASLLRRVCPPSFFPLPHFSSHYFSSQALIELANEVIAARMVEYYTSMSTNLRGRPIYVQYSNYKELKTNSACAQQVNTATPG